MAMQPATASHLESTLRMQMDAADWTWHQRRNLARSPTVTLGCLGQFQSRLHQHLAALGRYGADAVPLAMEGLMDPIAGYGFAAGWTLLHQSQATMAKTVVEATRSSEGRHRLGLFGALASSNRPEVSTQIAALAREPVSVLSALAMETLCRLGKAEAIRPLVMQRLLEGDAEITAILWKAAEWFPSGTIPQSAFTYALTHAPAETDENRILETAALHRQSWILDWCRNPSLIPAHQRARLRWLAVLGGDVDADLLRRHRTLLGEEYHALLALHGYRGHLEEIIEDLGNDDPRISVRAGLAFQRMTGVNVESDVRVEIPPEDGTEPDAVDREFQPLGFLPDQSRAKDAQQSLPTDVRPNDRFVAGQVVTLDTPFPGTGDCEAAWSYRLRRWMARENADRPGSDIVLISAMRIP